MIAPGSRPRVTCCCMTTLAEQIKGSTFFTVLSLEKIIGFFLIGVFSTLIDVGILYLFTTDLGICYKIKSMPAG